MSTPKDYVATFAGAGSVTFKTSGRYLRVLEAPSSAVFIRIGGGSELKRAAGQSVAVGTTFTEFTVRSTVAQDVRIVVSDEPQDDAGQAVSVSVTANVAPGDTLTSTADVALTAGVATQVLAGRADRLGVIVKNLDGNTSAIRVGDSSVAAARGHELLPGESIYLATTSTVWGFSTPGESVSVLEVRDV